MSHFSVAVFTDENTTVEDLLEPFYEGIEVEPYIALTKEQIIQRGKRKIKRFEDMYKQYRKDKKSYRRKYFDNNAHLRFIKKVPSMSKWNKEKIYKFATRYYSEEEIAENGDVYSTYNPNSKWDWYEIGRQMVKYANSIKMVSTRRSGFFKSR